MCCDTKLKISSGLKELMKEKPIRKITVQDIMGRKNMKRQSFYYHFQDIYDVIEWTCEYEFIDKIKFNEKESFEEWIAKIMNLFENEKCFLKKVLEEMERENVVKRLRPAVEGQVRRLIGNSEQLIQVQESAEKRNFIIEFTTTSIIYYMLDYASSRKKAEVLEVLKSVRYSLELLSPYSRNRVAFVQGN